MSNGNWTQTGTPRAAGDVGAIDILLQDHQAVKRLFAQLTSGGADARLSILQQLKVLLTVHNATEENLVYPAIRVLAERPQDADTLYHQQDEAKVGIWELDSMLKGELRSADFDARAAELRDAVLAHIEKEEETEFPRLAEALAGRGGQELTAAVRELRANFKYEGPVV
jgi:hemerythrin superfamily protein